MTTTEPGFNADKLRNLALTAITVGRHDVTVDPASILALLDEVERLRAQAGKATVETVNRLLGVNLWDARSFRADVRIDFDVYGAVLRAELAEGGAR